MPTEPLMLIGAGGHARVVFDALCASGAHAHVQVRDDVRQEASAGFAGLAIETPALPAQLSGTSRVHVAIGNNTVRRRLADECAARGARLVVVAHPRAIVSVSASIAGGTFLAAQCVVGPLAKLGVGVIVNHAAVVDHDCVVGDFTHIAPGAVLGGGVKVGAGALIGSGAVLLPGVRVADNAVVGAGAVVTRDVAGGTVIGAPARSLEHRN